MRGFSGKRLMKGSLSARSTTLATRRAMTAAAAMEERCRPYSLSMRARSRSTMWKVTRKKMVGGSTSRNSCFTVCQSLVMVSPSDGQRLAWPESGRSLRGASRPVAGAAMRALRLGLDLDATVPDGLAEGVPVALVLIGVGHREVREGLVEGLRLPEITRDQPGRAGTRVCAGERPSTGLRVLPHGRWREEPDKRLELHVAELPHVEVATLGPDGPAQEQVAGRLHEALADHHPLAPVGIGRGAHVGLEDRMARLLHLQEERIVGG